MDKNRRPGYWAVLPSDVRYDPELRPNAKLLYAEISALSNSTGYCWATNEWFAELFDLSVSTVSRLVSQLEEKGYIQCEMAATEKGSERRIYAGIFSVHVRRGGIGENSKTPLRKNSKTPLGENSKTPNMYNNININNPPISPKGERRARVKRPPRDNPDWKPERFNGLWEFYPKKGRKNKQDAMDAWDTLRPNDELIAAIGMALIKLKATDEWKRDIGIPYVATFLRGERWHDADELPELTAPRQGSGGWADDEEVL